MAGSERKRTTTVERRARKSAGSTKSHANSSDVSRDEIARRAYEIYLSRGGMHGGDVEDWLQAEREMARS